jgi:hypothetical protein
MNKESFEHSLLTDTDLSRSGSDRRHSVANHEGRRGQLVVTAADEHATEQKCDRGG